MSMDKETPQEIERRKQVEQLQKELTGLAIKKAKEVGLAVEVGKEFRRGEINFTDVSPSDGYCRYHLLFSPDFYYGWRSSYLGTVTIKAKEPKPGRSWSSKTIHWKAKKKDGTLNADGMLKWIEELAVRKANLAQWKIESDKQKAEEDARKKASDAIQRSEIGKVLPKGVEVVREEDGRYTIRFHDEVGTFSAGDVRAILDIVWKTRNS